MPVQRQRRSAKLSTSDRDRLDVITGRTGMSPSAAVRVATRLLAETTPLEDYEPELDALADELKATEGAPTVWGYSVPPEDDDLLSEVVHGLEHGPRRPSRSEVVRLGLRRTAALPEDELHRRFLQLDRVTMPRPWRSGSSIHSDLMAALGPDFHDVTTEELNRRISSALDPRMTWEPIDVSSDEDHRHVILAWRSHRGASTKPDEIRVLPGDSARRLSRLLVPFICSAEEAVRDALRAAREEKLGRSP